MDKGLDCLPETRYRAPHVGTFCSPLAATHLDLVQTDILHLKTNSSKYLSSTGQPNTAGKHVPIERHALSSIAHIANTLADAFRCKAEDNDAMRHVEKATSSTRTTDRIHMSASHHNPKNKHNRHSSQHPHCVLIAYF